MPGGACAGGALLLGGVPRAAVLTVGRWYWGTGLLGLVLLRSGILLSGAWGGRGPTGA